MDIAEKLDILASHAGISITQASVDLTRVTSTKLVGHFFTQADVVDALSRKLLEDKSPLSEEMVRVLTGCYDLLTWYSETFKDDMGDEEDTLTDEERADNLVDAIVSIMAAHGYERVIDMKDSSITHWKYTPPIGKQLEFSWITPAPQNTKKKRARKPAQ